MPSRAIPILRVLVCLLVFHGVAAAGGERDHPIVEGELGEKLDDYLQRLVPWGFSGTVLVARDHQIVLAKGYGLADREKHIPMTTETVISVGSITKQFTAAAILKLEMQGKLSVQDPITKYFTNVPPEKRAITLHHLLTHSAGLKSDFGDDFERVTRDETIRRALASKLLSKPGERFHYANSGYSLLGAIVELVSGQPSEQFLHEQLFQPAGMTQTGYRLPSWRPEDLAQGYEQGHRYGTIVERLGPDGTFWNLCGNGGIHSTIGDMYRWHCALEGDTVLSAAEREKFITPYIPEDRSGTQSYAYGWGVRKTKRNTRLIAHNGSDGIFYAECRRYPDDHAFIYFATNPSELVNVGIGGALDSIVFGGTPSLQPPTPAHVDAGVLSRYAGTFQLPAGDKLHVGAEQKTLVVRAEGPEALLALTGGRHSSAEQLAELSQRTRTILEARDHGDYEPLRQAFGRGTTVEEVRERATNYFKNAEQEWGTYQGFDLVGSVPGKNTKETYVRLRFARGSQVLCYRWVGGRLVGVQPAKDSPATRTFVPESPTDFATFSFSAPASVKLHFDANADGTISGVTLHARDGDIVARKISS